MTVTPGWKHLHAVASWLDRQHFSSIPLSNFEVNPKAVVLLHSVLPQQTRGFLITSYISEIRFANNILPSSWDVRATGVLAYWLSSIPVRSSFQSPGSCESGRPHAISPATFVSSRKGHFGGYPTIAATICHTSPPAFAVRVVSLRHFWSTDLTEVSKLGSRFLCALS